MATRITSRLIDDLDGTDATETVHFAYAGDTYTIDLNATNAARLRKALKPYIEHGTRLKVRPKVGTIRPRPGARAADETTPEGRNTIRQWARANGWPNTRQQGSIAYAVLDAYRKAHGRH